MNNEALNRGEISITNLRSESEIMKNWKGDLSTPLVSICTITYNHESFVVEAIESFLMQETDFPFEIVIDDDASPDKTADIVREYAKKYPHIFNVNLREKNVGSMTNFVENMKRVNGKYIALCEGDDYWTDPLKLQKQIGEMKKYPKCNISVHPANKINFEKKTISILGDHGKELQIISANTIIATPGQFAATSSYCFKKTVLSELPSWFEKEAPVGDFFIEAYGASGGCLYIPDGMSIYRTQVESSWSNVTLTRFSENKLIFNQAMVKVLEKMKIDFNAEAIQSLEAKQSYNILHQTDYYLHHGKYKIFREKITKAYMLSKNRNKEIMWLYRFRYFPCLFKKIYKFKLLISKK